MWVRDDTCSDGLKKLLSSGLLWSSGSYSNEYSLEFLYLKRDKAGNQYACVSGTCDAACILCLEVHFDHLLQQFSVLSSCETAGKTLKQHNQLWQQTRTLPQILQAFLAADMYTVNNARTWWGGKKMRKRHVEPTLYTKCLLSHHTVNVTRQSTYSKTIDTLPIYAPINTTKPAVYSASHAVSCKWQLWREENKCRCIVLKNKREGIKNKRSHKKESSTEACGCTSICRNE